MPSDAAIEWRVVHDGAVIVRTKEARTCNAYCRNGVHCDVWYIKNQGSLPLEDWQCVVDWATPVPRVDVVRVEPAYEAGPMPDTYVRAGTSVAPPDEERLTALPWLVFWKVRSE